MLLFWVFVSIIVLESLVLWSHYTHQKKKSTFYKTLYRRVILVGVLYTLLEIKPNAMLFLLITLVLVLMGEIFIGNIDLLNSLKSYLSMLGIALLFIIVPLVFFILLTPLVYVISMSGFIAAIGLFYLLFSTKVVRKKVELTPYIFEDDDFLPKQLKNQVYMVKIKAVRLPINALLLKSVHNPMILLSKALLSKLDAHEVRGIIAHEVGHSKKRHLLYRVLLVLSFIILLSIFGIVMFNYRVINVEIFALYYMMVYIFYLTFKIILMRLVQRQEFEADDFVKKLGLSNNLIEALNHIERIQPSPSSSHIYKSLFWTHPQTSQRIHKLSK